MSVLKWYIWRMQCQKWHSDAKWQLFRQANITGVSMSNQTQIAAVDSPKRRGRGRFRWLGGAVVLVLGLILAGTIYESVSEAADIRAYPPPGQMVDVGGYRLHINCTGTGSPTVVIDAGWGDWSLPWGWVQGEVAKTTQVCTYDRAGMGYSEAGPLPRNAGQFAKELHILLQRANIARPLCAGRPLAGRFTGACFCSQLSDGSRWGCADRLDEPWTDVATAHRNRASDSLPIQWSLTSLPVGAHRLRAFVAGPLGFIESPPEAKSAYTAFSVAPQSVQAWVDEGASVPESVAQADAIKTFGDLPLIVLSAGLNKQTGWQACRSNCSNCPLTVSR